jgi:hypothetical protein
MFLSFSVGGSPRRVRLLNLPSFRVGRKVIGGSRSMHPLKVLIWSDLVNPRRG